MQQHETDLIRDLIKANKDEILAHLDAQGAEISEIKISLAKLQEEYDNVLVEMKATRKIIKLAGGIISFSGGVATLLYYLKLFGVF